jgi:superfamily II DNA or RNA helicase
LGLTATPNRKDGLTKVFKWHIGDIAFQTSSKKDDQVNVVMKVFETDDRVYSEQCFLYNNKPNIARMINNICECVSRVDFVVNEIKSILEAEPQRRLLVLSERKSHLMTIQVRLKDACPNIETGLFFGGLKDAQLRKAEESQIILATMQMTAEGFDRKGLDTLILASPKSDVVQIVGRVLRDKKEDRKHIPMVLDIVDNFSVFTNQAKKRKTYYKKMNYDVKDE